MDVPGYPSTVEQQHCLSAVNQLAWGGLNEVWHDRVTGSERCQYQLPCRYQ